MPRRVWPFSEVRPPSALSRGWGTSGHQVRLLLAADFMSTHPQQFLKIDLLALGLHLLGTLS